MARDQPEERLDIVFAGHRFQIHFGAIATLREVARLIENVSDAARHSRGEVAARLAQNDDKAVRHVFAAVIADSFDNGSSAGIAHGKTFAGHAAKKRLAARGAIEAYVSD